MSISFSNYLTYHKNKDYCPKYYTEDQINKIVIKYLDNVKYDEDTCYEYVNPILLELLIKNREEVEKRLKAKKGRLNYYFNIMRVILKIQKNGYYVTNYYSSANSRQYVKNNISIQLFKRELRQILSYSIYYDIDIKNCHPTILTHILESNNLKCGETLKEYRDHRDECIQELIRLNPNLNRKDVKEALLAIINGGFSYIKKFKNKNDFITKFTKEVKEASKVINENNKDIYDMCYIDIKELNERGLYDIENNGRKYTEEQLINKAKKRTVSYFMTRLENDILNCMTEFCKDKGYYEHILIKLFDGFQIPNNTDIKIVKKGLTELEEKIKKKFGITIYLKVKPFNDCDKLVRSIPQEVFCKKPNNKELNKMINSCEFESHRYSLLNNLLNNNIKFDLRTKKKYIDSYDEHIEDNDTLFIKSQMGSGKTHRLYNFLKKYRKKNIKYSDILNKNIETKSILFISFRRSLERKYLEDLDLFENYEDIDSRYIDPANHPRLVIQINSLHRIIGTYDFIVLDEVSYVFDTLISYCDNKVRIYNVLKQLLESCEKLVCMDAYISKEDIDYIKALRPNRKNYTILNEVPEIRGNVLFYEKDNFLHKLITDIDSGYKIIFASNSKTFLKKKVVPLLIDSGINYLLITNETENIDPSTWNNYQVVLYTPTIVAGISFDAIHFDKRYGYFSNISSPANMCCQQLFRVRNTSDNNIYLLIHEFGKRSHPVEIEDVIKYLHKYINLENNVLGKHVTDCMNSGFVDFNIVEKRFKQDHYSELLYNYMIKINKSKNNLKSQILNFLAVQGYIVHHLLQQDLSEDIKLFNKNAKEVTDNYNNLRKEEDLKLYKEIKTPTDIEFENITNKDKKSINDKIKLNLYSLKNQGIDFDNYAAKMIPKIIRNINNTKFDAAIKKEKKIRETRGKRDDDSDDDDDDDDGELDPIGFCLDRILYHSKYNKNKTFNKSRKREYMFIDEDDCNDNIIIEHCGGREEVDFYVHKQHKRDYWLKCYHSLKLLKVIGFNSRNDFMSELDKFENEIMKEIHTYILLNWTDFTMLFGISKKMKDFKHFSESNNLISSLNSKIKIINRKILKKTRGKKKIIYYILEKIIDF